MLRVFFKDSVVYGTARIVTSGISLLLVPLYTRALSLKDYGTVDFLTVLANLVYLTVALEIGQGFARHFGSSDNEALRKRYASTALWFTVGANTVFATAVFFLSPYLSVWLLDSPAYENILRVAVLAVWGQGVFVFVQNYLRYDLQPKRYAVASIAYSVTLIGMSLIFLAVLRLGLTGVFLAQVFANIVGMATGFYLGRRGYDWTYDWGKCQEMLRFSVPLVFSSVGVFAATFMDRIVIKNLMSLSDLGIYAVGYRLASIVILVMAGFQIALTPLIYQHYQREQAPVEIERMFRWFLAFTIPLVLLVGFFSSEALAILATSDYSAARQVIFLLAFAFLVSNMYMFAPGVWIAKKTAWVAIINLATAGLNLGLNLVLVPRVGILGPALSAPLSALTALACYLVLGRSSYPIPYQWMRIVPAMGVTLALGALTIQPLDAGAGLAGSWGVLIKGMVLAIASLGCAVLLLGRNEISLSASVLSSRLRTLNHR